MTGSYASLLDCKELVLPNWDRVSWLASQCDSKTEAAADCSLAQTHHLTTKIAISLAFRQIYVAINRTESNKSSFSNHDVSGLLQQLHKARSFVERNSGPDELHCTLIKRLNEYIILVDEVTANPELDKDTPRSLLEDMKVYVISTCKSQQIELPELNDPIAPQPRKDIVKSFSAPIPTAINNSLVHAMRIAFQCFDTRILTLSKWYEKYFDIVANHPEISSNESLFFVVIQQLVHCGFIKKLTSARRKDEAYEKIAVVWGQ
jgi:hypothetical protein